MNEQNTLGVDIKKKREELHLTIDEIADSVFVHPRFIQALESGNYAVFSARVYAEGVCKKVLARLGIEEHALYGMRLRAEWEDTHKNNQHVSYGIDKTHKNYSFSLKQHPVFILIGVLLSAAALFFGVRLLHALHPPILTLHSPGDGTLTHESFILLQGVTEPESRLTVNGREIKIGEHGEFEEYMGLQTGLNTLVFLVEDRLGKEQMLIRRIVVQ